MTTLESTVAIEEERRKEGIREPTSKTSKVYELFREVFAYLKDPFYVKESLGQYEEIDGELRPTKIQVLKFRTMYKEAEKDLSKVVQDNGYGPHGKPLNDPRILPWAQWMRKYHVDEIPQGFKWLLGLLPFVKQEYRLLGTSRPRTQKDWELSGFSDEYKREVLKYKPSLIPPDLCISKRIDDCDEEKQYKRYIAAHRLSLRKLKKGELGWSWFGQFLKNKVLGMHSS